MLHSMTSHDPLTRAGNAGRSRRSPRALPPDSSGGHGAITAQLSPQPVDPLLLAYDTERAGTFGPLDELAVSTRCPFSPAAAGSVVTPEQRLARLRLVVKVAYDVFRWLK
jgi:5-methyltetrahydropteroyltriglutamate--homocysteine methyltransferase